MIAKEWRDARWKLFLGTMAVLVLAALVIPPYERMRDIPNPSNLSGEFGTATGNVLVPLAALLGVGLISGEAGRNTIVFLLSRPLSRTRLLMAKYAVGAGSLLAVSSLSGVGVLVSAAARGYPIGQFNAWGVGLSVLLMWLGSLSVFGVALLISIFSKDVMRSVVTTVPAVYLLLLLPGPLMDAVLQSLPEPPDRSFYDLSLVLGCVRKLL